MPAPIDSRVKGISRGWLLCFLLLLFSCLLSIRAADVPDESVIPKLGLGREHAGSTDCKSCHGDQHSSWHKSYHRTMTQLPVPGAVKANFNQVVLTNAGVRFRLSQSSNHFWVRMESELPGTPDRPAPEPTDVPLGLVTGSHHMQVFWLPNGMGNAQIGFPFTWLIPEQRWVPRNSTFIRPPSFQHRPETWNHVCSRCHATAVEPKLNRAEMRWETEVEELGISCEACHGPSEKHVAAMRELEKAGKKPTPGSTPLHVVNPEKLSPTRASQVCGFCHSMKWWEGQDGWPVKGFTYRPGDDLEATTPVMRPTQIERQPWLQRAAARNPDLLGDFFWSDGMVKVSGRDYNGLIESPCYKGGQFSCLSCHSMHNSEPANQLDRDIQGNRACLQCHEKYKTEAAQTAHTRHKAGSSGSECYNCHMPHTSYGVLKAIRSHQVSSPKVQDQLATGRPNACNLCHLDKTLGWTARQLNQWFKHPEPVLNQEQTTMAESVRMGMTGDAGQRALIAWHLGWEPAVAVSGKDWIPPLLGELLDDPYSAVRCVAERALKKTGPTFLPKGYDFTPAPEMRTPALAQILKEWSKPGKPVGEVRIPRETGFDVGDPAKTSAVLMQLKTKRNNRDVRLRE